MQSDWPPSTLDHPSPPHLHPMGEAQASPRTPAERVLHNSDTFFRRFIHVWLAICTLLTAYSACFEPASMYACVTALGCGVLAKLLLLRGHKLLVRWLFVVPLFVMLMVAPWLVNGVRTPLLVHGMLMLIFTGWMLGIRAMWVVATGLSATVLGLWWAESSSSWHMPQPLRDHHMWMLVLLFSVLSTAITMHALLRNYRMDLARETAWQSSFYQALQFNALVIDSSPVPIRVFQADGRCIAVNPAYADLMGLPREFLLAQNLRESKLNAELTADCWRALQSGEAMHREVPVTTRDGRTLWLHVHLAPFERDGQRHLLAHLMDMTEQHRATQELKQLAFYDSLTGLANRRLFWEHFQHVQQLCQRNDTWAAVMLLDLNRFKQLNDQHGHAMGDLMLQEVARRLQCTVRGSDLIARLGGDEFTLLAQGMGATEAEAHANTQQLCEKLHAVLSAPYQLQDLTYAASASIGAAWIDPQAPQPLDALLRDADAQMYAQKRARAQPESPERSPPAPA